MSLTPVLQLLLCARLPVHCLPCLELRLPHCSFRPTHTAVQRIDQLPSARLPSRWAVLLRPAAQFAALFAICAAVHSFGRAVSVAGSIAVGLVAAGWGLWRDSLDRSGAVSVSDSRA